VCAAAVASMTQGVDRPRRSHGQCGCGSRGVVRVILLSVLMVSCVRVAPPLLLPRVAMGDSSFLPTMEAFTAAAARPGNRADLLLNGDQIFPAQLEAIRSARSTITYAQYVYEDSVPGRAIVDAISERCRSGIKGHVLVDGFGSLYMPPVYREIFDQAGCEVAIFHPLGSWAIGKIDHRNHRRILVVDGRIGFTGGSGASTLWMGNGRREGYWRQTDVRVEGPVVNDLQAAFAENWLEATGRLLGGEGYFVPQRDKGSARAQVVRSSPDQGSFAIYSMFLLAITAARHSVFITNPYFVPDNPIIDAILAAHQRGVRVVLLLPGDIDNNTVRKASRAGFGRLLDGGVEIYEYQSGMLHAKTMAVDGIWGTVGSANLDNRSLALNDEMNLVAHDREFVAHLEKVFGDDLAHSRPINPQRWRTRGLWERFREFFALSFSGEL
jgi:cardiolipin synthase